MKKILFMIMAFALLAVSCDPSLKAPKTAEVTVKLFYENVQVKQADITVAVKDNNSTATYEAATDSEGVAVFTLPSGLYSASVSYRGDMMHVYNGLNGNISVTAGTDTECRIDIKSSKVSQIVIKELYVGGCMQDDGAKTFAYDGYMILYNNTDIPADASDICFALGSPLNSNAKNKYLVDGKLSYESQGWIPASYGIWYFTSPVEIAPYSQIVVALRGAIDHTKTHSNSVDLSKGEYYCMYDPESGFNNATSYPAPSEAIPSSHHLKVVRYGMGNAWPYSQLCPAMFILKNDNIAEYAGNQSNYDLTDGEKLPNVKVPVDWVVDGIEVYDAAKMNDNKKRLTSEIDNGFVTFTNKLGYTLYRNVDKEATEAIEGNKEKLVYEYKGGTEDLEGSTDPSGIDAEASIKKGAVIIYKDTNNSTNDFHQRKISSLK